MDVPKTPSRTFPLAMMDFQMNFGADMQKGGEGCGCWETGGEYGAE